MKHIVIKLGGISNEVISNVIVERDVDPTICFSDGGDRKLSPTFSRLSGCATVFVYLEEYVENIITHETIHLAIYDVFCGWSHIYAQHYCYMLDSFDNWGLNPISFSRA